MFGITYFLMLLEHTPRMQQGCNRVTKKKLPSPPLGTSLPRNGLISLDHKCITPMGIAHVDNNTHISVGQRRHIFSLPIGLYQRQVLSGIIIGPVTIRPMFTIMWFHIIS